ncbi:enoyl-CoA hydratase [Pseudogracilibacillus sp. SE30717A]|uniref:enoyl-CoA hydratase n=1 Tax=Pseudogracilibacillus sp. SE30717A TaxID=3098293 RepID=UPI00300DC377
MSTLVSFVKEDNYIGIITLNRPEAANALSVQLLNALNNVLYQIENDQSLRCIIITGAKGKAFCAGADLKERRGMSDDKVIQTVNYIGETITRVEQLSIPVIAAINGVAFGGGLELALACDIRITTNTVKMGLTETSLAIIPGAGGTQRLARLISPGQAKRLIYTAQPIDAKQAEKIGLVEIVVNNDQLDIETKNIANQIAANGPIAIKQAKASINLGMETDLRTGLHIEHLCYKQTIPTEDRLEGLQAFKEKRRPEYKGN